MVKKKMLVCVVCGVPLFNRIRLAMYCDDCLRDVELARACFYGHIPNSKALRFLNEKYVFSFKIALRNKDGLARKGVSQVCSDNPGGVNAIPGILPVLKGTAAGSSPAQTNKEEDESL